MLSLAVAAHQALYIARPASQWVLERHLEGKSPECIAIDALDPSRLYVGTWGNGIWSSVDGGRTWEPAGDGIPHQRLSAIAVGRWHDTAPGPIFAGTEPSTLSKSDDGGRTWQELGAMLALPSASQWSFPPKPETHHVRWIESDPSVRGKLYVAIEAGALVQSSDNGETWSDRVPGGPYDTHTAATHPGTPGRIISSAGDGYFESADGGLTWTHPMQGLGHRYLVGIAMDPGDPETVVVSAASGPHLAYQPTNAEAYLYRKQGAGDFQVVVDGLPDGRGSIASRLATHPEEPGVFYAANNHGLFRSADSGLNWQVLEIEWPPGAFHRGVDAVAAFSE